MDRTQKQKNNKKTKKKKHVLACYRLLYLCNERQ